MLARALVAVLALSCGAGCSFGMATVPSGKVPSRTVARACAKDFLLPIGDTVAAGLGVYGTAVSLSAEDKVLLYGVEIDKEAGLAISLTQLGLFGAGAVYGYIQVARCNAARKHHRLDGPPPEPPAPPLREGYAIPTDHSERSGEQAAREQPGEGKPDATDLYDVLPDWSAFRRVPVDPPRSPEGTETEPKPARPAGR